MVTSKRFNSEIDVPFNPLYSLYDLSFLEILVLNQLVKRAHNPEMDKTAILRHDLYKQINDLVKSHKKLSTSSFYRSLKKMKDRGLLEEKKSDDVNYRNAVEVYATEEAGKMVGFVFHFMTQFNQDQDILKYIESNLISSLRNSLDLSTLRVVRIVDPSISMNAPADLISSILPDAVGIMQIMGRLVLKNPEVAFSVNPLTTDQIFSRDHGELPPSDLIIFPLYDRNVSYRGLDYLGILEHLKEQISPLGYVLLIHLEEISSDHQYVDVFRGLLEQTPYYRTFNSNQLEEQLTTIGIKCLTQFSHRGVSFVLCQLDI